MSVQQGDWYCVHCGYIAPQRVTYEELCDQCHQPVEWHSEQDEPSPWKQAVENHLAGWYLTADDFGSADEAILKLLRLELEAALDPKISTAAANLAGVHKCTWRAAISPGWVVLVWVTKCGRSLPLLKDPVTHYEMKWCPFCRGELMNEYEE